MKHKSLCTIACDVDVFELNNTVSSYFQVSDEGSGSISRGCELQALTATY